MRRPQKLSKDAKEYWDFHADMLVSDRRLCNNTKFAFVNLCECYAQLQAARRDRQDTIKIVCLEKQFTNQQKGFGLTPESYKRLKLDQQNEPQDIGQAIRKAMGA